METTKILAVSLITLLLVILLAGCSLSPEKEIKEVPLMDGYIQYETESYNVQYKDDWTTEETEVNGIKTSVFLSPEKTSTVDIIKEDLAVKYTLEQYKTASITNLKNKYAISEVNEEKVIVNGYEAYRLTYSAVIKEVTIDVTQTLIVQDKMAFVIAFSGLDAGVEEVYHNMENTFVIK